MKQKISTVRIERISILAILIFFAGLLTTHAQTTVFTYQGRLSDGAMAASGNYDLSFALYDAETGGNQIGTTLARPSVNVSNGIFTVQLDFGASPFAAGANRYLQIAVKKPSETNYTPLTPRQPLTSSPYSIQSLSAKTADSLSSACVGCVTNAQINSIDGAKVSGTVARANTANSAATATTANSATTAGNVTGIVAIANGGTGSATKNFVDLTTAQTVAGAKTFSNDVRTNGLMRSGSETGTSEAPRIDDLIGTYTGLVTRRINSSDSAAGTVVARMNVLRLERDGTNSGWRIANDALTGDDYRQSIHCIGISDTGTVFPVRLQLSSNAAGTNVLYSNAKNIEYFQCSFGNPYSYGHQTQVVMQRYAGDFVWVGTVTSTFNQ